MKGIAPVIRPSTAAGVGLLALMLLLLALPPASVWTLSLIGLGLALAILSPRMMIAVVLLTIPVQEAIVLPYPRGDFTLTQIALFGLVLGWGVTFWRYRIWLDAITLWYAAIGGAFLISLVAMDEAGLWVGEVYRWAVAALFFVICRSVLRDWASVRVVVWAMVAATLATWAYAAGQAIAAQAPEHLFRGGWLRVSAEFGTPNPLAAYIEFTIPILLVFAILGFRQSFRRELGAVLWALCGVTTVLGLLILALTQSRGGMVGFALAMVVVLWVLPTRLRLGAIVAGAVLVGIVLLTPAGQSQVGRFSAVFESREPSPTGRIDDHNFGRASLWIAGIRMFEAHPWTGIGAGEYDYHYREFTPVWYDRFPLGQAHNGWLQMAAQAGLAGIVAFSGWVIASLVALVGAMRRSTGSVARALALGALAVMVAFTVHSLVDYLNVLSLGLQISAVLAIGLNLSPDPLKAYVQTDRAEASRIDVPRTGVA